MNPTPQHEPNKDSTDNPRRRGLPLYFSLLAIQTIGIFILLANIIPVYRLMSLDFANYRPDPRPWWALIGIGVSQAAYWMQARLRPLMPDQPRVLLGHVFLFIPRISFVCVTSTFTVMFITRLPDLKNLDYSPLRALFLLVMFFAIFCWTLDIEKLGKSMMDQEKNDRPLTLPGSG